MAILSAFGRQGVNLGLLNRKVDIEDTNPTSKYFAVNEFNSTFTAGKNAVGFNGTAFLQNKSEIQVECLDSNGNSLYIEHAKATGNQYTDTSKFLISVHVYEETYNGNGKLILVGTTKLGESVRWIANIRIDKSLPNTSTVRFYTRPSIEILPLLYPVIDMEHVQTDWPPPDPDRRASGIATISSGVGSIKISKAGTGYAVNETVRVVGGGGSSTLAKITAVDSQGGVQSIGILHSGNNYTSIPTAYIDPSDSSGTGVLLVVELSSIVTGVNITDSGKGYTFTPSVTFKSTNGAGSGASAHVIMNAGMVNQVIIDSPGSGYLYPPSVLFEVPSEPPAADLNISKTLEGNCYTHAANPLKDTPKFLIDQKKTDVDYRLVYSNISSEYLTPDRDPSNAFNVQMEGKTITIHVTKIQLPNSFQELELDETFTTTIKKVLDLQTIQLADPYYYTVGKNQLIANILSGDFSVSYRCILYNTNKEALKEYQIDSENVVSVKESYAEITYRNIKPFSGCVNRHKVYRKSSFSTGDFGLVSDELLVSPELLYDPVTTNRFYDKIGIFYHDEFISKYWYSSSDNLTLEAVSNPINSMRIFGADTSLIDGTDSVMAKLDTIDEDNDNIYWNFDQTSFNNLSGKEYNCNFISLKKDTKYILSTNLILEKNESDEASVEFYFTSSIAAIKLEDQYNYINAKWLLGKVTCDEKINKKYYPSVQQIFFTPKEDYYGTLVIVPKKCNVILSNLSMKVYGDIGYSPDVLVVRIPWPVKVAKEAFDIKAELLDINSTVVYSEVRTTQTFDNEGESLYAGLTDNPLNDVMNVTYDTYNYPQTSLSGEFFLPDLSNDVQDRFVGYILPTGTEEDGKLIYTNVSKLYIDSDDYIVVSEYQSGVEHTAKSVAVVYDFDVGWGRKIVVYEDGTKETFK